MPGQYQLFIDGMHCAACVRRVTAALQSLPGVAVQTVDIGSAQVSSEAAEDRKPDLSAAIDRIGFTVTHIETK